MKQISLLLLTALLAVAACTHNNGDIGNWFGTWNIEEVAADGVAVNLDPANVGAHYFLQFQTSVVCLRHDDTRHNGGASYGTWQENDDQFTLDFPDEKARDVFLPGLDKHNTFTITSRSGNTVVMETVDAGGVHYRYTLKKLY